MVLLALVTCSCGSGSSLGLPQPPGEAVPFSSLHSYRYRTLWVFTGASVEHAVDSIGPNAHFTDFAPGFVPARTSQTMTVEVTGALASADTGQDACRINGNTYYTWIIGQ